MKRIGFVMLLSVLIVGVATAAFSWGGGPGGHGRGPGYGPCAGGDMAALSGLNLTAAQTEKISTMRDSFRREIKPLQDKMFSKRGDLRLLWLEKSPDQQKILAAQKELRAVRGELQDKMTAHHLAVLKVLTPEQQTKLRSHMGRGMGRGHGMGMGPCTGTGGGPGFGHRGNR